MFIFRETDQYDKPESGYRKRAVLKKDTSLMGITVNPVLKAKKGSMRNSSSGCLVQNKVK